MKLSEALMLGTTLGEKVNNLSWNTCLLGISCHALGVTNFGNSAAKSKWPWLDKSIMCPMPFGKCPIPAADFITGLSIKVELGEMTIEDAVAIIRAIEPAETITAMDFRIRPDGTIHSQFDQRRRRAGDRQWLSLSASLSSSNIHRHSGRFVRQ